MDLEVIRDHPHEILADIDVRFKVVTCSPSGFLKVRVGRERGLKSGGEASVADVEVDAIGTFP